MQKKCSKCGRMLPLSEYDLKKTGDGIKKTCKRCVESVRLRYEANPEKVKESARRRWHELNSKRKESNKRWQKANPEKLREYDKRWREANPEIVYEYSQTAQRKLIAQGQKEMLSEAIAAVKDCISAKALSILEALKIS